MACNEVSYWKKTLMRRQFPTAKHSHPWIIKLASQLQEPISKHIVNVLMWTYHFGVQTLNGRTKKEQIVEVTSKPKFQQMLRACLGNEEVSLKRKIKGKGGKTDIIIDRKKPFTIQYLQFWKWSGNSKMSLWGLEQWWCSPVYLTFLLKDVWLLLSTESLSP